MRRGADAQRTGWSCPSASTRVPCPYRVREQEVTRQPGPPAARCTRWSEDEWERGAGVDVQGTVEDGLRAGPGRFRTNFERRGERGAAVAVYRHGRKVVDLWAGTKDGDADGAATPAALGAAPPRSSAPPPRASPPPSRCCCTSADSSTWTRRSARTGRSSRRTARSASSSATSSSHRAGLPALDRPLTPAEAADGVSGAAAVAAQAPAWEPGTDHGYHAQTYSWLRRRTGAAASPDAPSAAGSPRRSPGRSAWTSGSACPRPRRTGVGRLGRRRAAAADGSRRRPAHAAQARPSPTPTPTRPR